MCKLGQQVHQMQSPAFLTSCLVEDILGSPSPPAILQFVAEICGQEEWREARPHTEGLCAHPEPGRQDRRRTFLLGIDAGVPPGACGAVSQAGAVGHSRPE